MEAINFGDCLVRSKGAVAIADAVRGGLPKLKVWLAARGLPPGPGSPQRGYSCPGRALVFEGRWTWARSPVLPHPRGPALPSTCLHVSEEKGLPGVIVVKGTWHWGAGGGPCCSEVRARLIPSRQSSPWPPAACSCCLSVFLLLFRS